MPTSPPQYQWIYLTEDDAVGLPFVFYEEDGVTPQDITGYVVALDICKTTKNGLEPSGAILEKAGVLSAPAQGQALFSFVEGDLNFFGKCDAQLKITDAGGATRRVGGFGFDIRRKLK